MMKRMQRPAKGDVGERTLKCWNANKLFQGFWNMSVVLQVPLYGPYVKVAIVDSRPIGDMKWLTGPFGLARRELIFESGACHLSVESLTTQ